MLNYMATMYFLSGEIPGQEGNGHFVHVPYNTFHTQSRNIVIAVIFDSFWESLLEVLDLPQEFHAEIYKTQQGRFTDKPKIEAAVQAAVGNEYLRALVRADARGAHPLRPGQ